MADCPSEQALSVNPLPSNGKPRRTSHLQYPQLLLDTSFDSLLTHSFPSNISRPANMDTPQQGPPSLSESWTSVSDADYSHDEDLHSEHTDFGSLIDLHSTDDAHSVLEGDSHSEAAVTGEDGAFADSNQQPAQLRSSEHTVHLSSSAGETRLIEDGQITLEEPESNIDEDHVLVKHTLKVFSKDELLNLGLKPPPRIDEEDYVGTIHIQLSKNSIKDLGRQTFRVLLFAPLASPTRDFVVGKIADALVAAGSKGDISTSQSPSRYHVVPDSFGPGSHPTAAEVIPIGCQLDVDEYHFGMIGGNEGSSVMLCNEDEMMRTLSRWDKRKQQYVIDFGNWRQPDLAVVVIDKDPSAEQLKSTCAMLLFARRHRIPTLVLRTDNSWKERYNPLILSQLGAQSGAQMCVEGRSLSKELILHRLTLNLDTFLNLNAGQLSRHIAYQLEQLDDDSSPGGQRSTANLQLMSAADSEKDSAKTDDSALTATATTGRQPAGYHERSSRLEHLMFSAVSFMASLVLLYVCGFVVVRGLVSIKTSWDLNHTPVLANIISPSITHFPNLPVHTPAGTPSLSIDTSKQVAVTETPPLLDASKSASGKYEVEIVGTSHLVIKVPNRVKSGDIKIEVFKKGVAVHAEVSKLFPSVYSARIIPEYAFGELVVKISARRSQLVEAIPVDMGEQPMDVWFKSLVQETEDNLRQQLALVQRSIEELRHPKRPCMKKLRKAFQEWCDKTARSIQEYDWETPRSQLARTLRKHQAALTKQIDKHAGAAREKLTDATQSGSQRGKVLVEQLAKQMSKVYDAFDSKQFRGNMDKLSKSLQERTQSDTLATAQERAHQIVQDARCRWSARRRGCKTKH